MKSENSKNENNNNNNTSEELFSEGQQKAIELLESCTTKDGFLATHSINLKRGIIWDTAWVGEACGLDGFFG